MSSVWNNPWHLAPSSSWISWLLEVLGWVPRSLTLGFIGADSAFLCVRCNEKERFSILKKISLRFLRSDSLLGPGAWTEVPVCAFPLLGSEPLVPGFGNSRCCPWVLGSSVSARALVYCRAAGGARRGQEVGVSSGTEGKLWQAWCLLANQRSLKTFCSLGGRAQLACTSEGSLQTAGRVASSRYSNRKEPAQGSRGWPVRCSGSHVASSVSPPPSFTETGPNSSSQMRFFTFILDSQSGGKVSPGPLSGVPLPLFSKGEADLGSVGHVTPQKTQKVPSYCLITTGWSRESVSSRPVCHLQKRQF